jgi:RAQPRD family integrative conjugative element protein
MRSFSLTRFYTGLAATLCLSLSLSPFSFSDVMLANQDLREAINDLEIAKSDVMQAKKQEPTNERVQFHYDEVILDLNKVESGIQAKFEETPVEPRVLAPISGDYLGLVGDPK